MAFPALSIRREYSAEAINAVINHPDVRPWVGTPDQGYIDVAPVVANLNNVLLMAEGGGFLFVQMELGIYEVHSQFVPEHRGPNVTRAAHDAQRWMFTRSDCVEIRTKVPHGNIAAAGLAKRMGFELQFSREAAWPTASGMVGVDYYAKNITQWCNTADEISNSGEWFHHKLEAAKVERGASSPVHDDDPAHDRYVGATVEMMMAGQIGKALGFYGRWASFAGYGPIAMVATEPVVIDIGDALLAVRQDDFDILLLR